MSGYIKREDALDAVLFALVGTGNQSKAIYAIRDVPTADVVEVVRCKDCKHFRVWETGSSTCEHWTYVDDVSTDPDAFCSYGERREENEG